jgi:NtrC-family two-component system sensor histidine kinase KinB
MVTGLGPRIDRLGAARIPLSDIRSLAARVATERRPRLVAPHAGEVGQVTEVFLSGDPLSLLCAPLISKKRLRGVIMLARLEPFRPAALTTMLNLSNIIAAALENVELYQAERAEREQLAAIFVSASDAIALVDNQMRLLEVNDAFAALVGLPQAELRGQSCLEALRRAAPESPLAEERGALARVLAGGEAALHVESAFAVDSDEPASRSTPGRQYVDFSVTPIAGREGRRALLVGRDVTAQREVEQMKARFLAMVSHELRGPLQTLDGFLDLALSGAGGALNAQQREFVQRARSGSQRLATIVDDLLLLSRRDLGQFALHQELTDLAPVVAEAAAEVEALVDEAGLRLELVAPERLPPVLADAPRIAQVLRNLLANAIKFTPRGGGVTLSAEADAAYVVLRVRDTGIGIAPEHQAKIFDRFYQAPAAAEQGRARGQGLGLAIARIIVEGHGGTVTVESAPGHGSIFTVRLLLLPG